MIGIDPASSKLVGGGIQPEIRQTLANIVRMLEKAGSRVDNVIKCTILLNDIVADYAIVNEEYARGKKANERVEQDNYANNFPFPTVCMLCYV